MTRYHVVLLQPYRLKSAVTFQFVCFFFIFENDKIIVSEEGKQMSQLAYLENTTISLRHDLYPGHLIFLATQLDHYNGHQLDILLKWIQNPAQAILWIEESKMPVVLF